MIGIQQRRFTFRTDYKGKHGMKVVAAFMNRVGKMINNLRVVDGDAIITKDAIWIRARGPDYNVPRSFKLTRAGDFGEVANISEGRIIPHGLGIFSVAADSVTLTGGPMVWVYVEVPIGAYTPGTIAVASGADATYEPITTNDTFRVTLYEFAYLAATSSYQLTNVRAGGQDINLMAVARG